MTMKHAIKIPSKGVPVVESIALSRYTRLIRRGIHLRWTEYAAIMKDFKSTTKYDPTGFTIACGCWSASLSLAILAPGPFFDSFPTFALLDRMLGFWDINEDAAGLAFLALAGLLFWSATKHASTPGRALVAFVSFAVWLMVGVAVIVGGGQLGIVSPLGLFCVVMAVGSLLSSAQWVNQNWTDNE